MVKSAPWLIFFAVARLLPAAAPQSSEMVTRGANQFAADVYGRLARGGDENLIFSPFSVYTVLSMALEGARGQTAGEMRGVLHQSAPDAEFRAAFARAVEQLIGAANANGTTLLNANGLWLDRNFRVLPPFREAIETLYHAPPAQLDFSANAEGARREINQWTSEHTKGKIGELFAPGALNSETRLVLSSATYFYGQWASAFPGRDTRPAPFRLTGGGTVEARFMNQTGRFGYAETPSTQILEMKYADGGMAFDVLLPKSREGIGELEKSVSAEGLDAWFRGLQSRTVEVALPKFRAESEFPLREVLAGLGMRSAFSNAADFSGIDDRRDLLLSQVMHKAFVDVSEEGTEAAAATGAVVSMIAAVVPPPRLVVFRADHPFLFLIRDTRSGTILFTGRLMKPKAS